MKPYRSIIVITAFLTLLVLRAYADWWQPWTWTWTWLPLVPTPTPRATPAPTPVPSTFIKNGSTNLNVITGRSNL